MIYFWSVLGLIFFIIIIALILILWTNTVISIKYINGNFSLKIKNMFYVYNYPSVKKTKPSNLTECERTPNDANIKEDENSKDENKNKKLLESLKNLDTIKNILTLIKDIVRLMRYKLKIEKLKIKVDYGNGDASNTGTFCGIFWTGYGVILPILINYFRLENPSVQFNPWFNSKICEIKFESIIKVKIGHIINTLIISGINYFKRKLKTK